MSEIEVEIDRFRCEVQDFSEDVSKNDSALAENVHHLSLIVEEVLTSIKESGSALSMGNRLELRARLRDVRNRVKPLIIESDPQMQDFTVIAHVRAMDVAEAKAIVEKPIDMGDGEEEAVRVHSVNYGKPT